MFNYTSCDPWLLIVFTHDHCSYYLQNVWWMDVPSVMRMWTNVKSVHLVITSQTISAVSCVTYCVLGNQMLGCVYVWVCSGVARSNLHPLNGKYFRMCFRARRKFSKSCFSLSYPTINCNLPLSVCELHHSDNGSRPFILEFMVQYYEPQPL